MAFERFFPNNNMGHSAVVLSRGRERKPRIDLIISLEVPGTG